MPLYRFGDCDILRLRCSKLEDMGKAVPVTTCTSRTSGGRDESGGGYGEENAFPACGRRKVLA